MAALAVLAAVSCADGDTPTSTSTASATLGDTGTSTATSTGATTPDADAPMPTPGQAAPETTGVAPIVVPEGFEQVAATVTASDGEVCEVCLWLAETRDQRARGLMEVTDLGAADGMAFVYPSPHRGAFWMKNTVMPLSIAFFDAGGAYMDAFDMEPCTSDPCTSYPTPDDFVTAVEVPQGGLDALLMTAGSTLTLVPEITCRP